MGNSGVAQTKSYYTGLVFSC